MDHASSLFAGISLGLSEVSGVCVNSSLQVKATATVGFGPDPDSRRNPELWWHTVQKVIALLLAQVDSDAIASIAVAGTSGTTIAVDDMGNPLSSALLYSDLCRDQELIKRIAASAPDTSAVHGARSGLARAVTLSNAFCRANIMCEADWITFKLSGLLGISDENNAVRAGYDPVNRQWPEWLKHTGMKQQALPHVLPAGQPIGPILKAIAGQTRLNPRTLVVSGTLDSCASFIATGASKPGDGVTSLGNRLNIRLLCEKPVYSPQDGIYSHRIGNYWLTGGGSNNAQKTAGKHFTAQEVKELCNSSIATAPMSLEYYSLTEPVITTSVNAKGTASSLSPALLNNANLLHHALQTMAGVEAMAYRRLNELGGTQVATIRTIGEGSLNDLWTAVRSSTVLARFYSTTSDQPAVGAALLGRNAVYANPVAV